MSSPEVPKRAQVVGTGLIGGSVAGALRRAGWWVTVSDRDPQVADRAVALGLADQAGTDLTAQLVVVATPVGDVAACAREALEVFRHAVVTDVGSVKQPVTEAVSHPGFVGGHPMAGSEQDGLDGARPTMFDGAVWVLTPTDDTDPTAYALVHSVAVSLGSDVLTMSPEDHDAVVAMVSHVPHLTAATLMGLASRRGQDHTGLLRIAAGGFRDMTRIASGRPGIWPDICGANRSAILAVLDDLIEELGDVRSIVASGDRPALLDRLELARSARRSLPVGAQAAAGLSEIRVTVPDRPGQIALVATVASEQGVNLFDIEIAHSAEGERGVIVVVIDASRADDLCEALADVGLSTAVQEVS